MRHAYTETSEAGDSLRVILRKATRTVHGRLDNHPLLQPLTKPWLTKYNYVQVLCAFYWIYQGLEPALQEATRRWGRGHEFTPSPRLDWLYKDLNEMKVDERIISLPPVLTSIDVPADAPATVGMLYVVEGSILGGRVIARQLEMRLGLTASNGAQYFNGHGEMTVLHWEQFWSFAIATCPPQQAKVAAHHAVNIFAQFENNLDVACQRFMGGMNGLIDEQFEMKDL